ncbi:MAG: hypothetical protein KK482_26210 [Sinorhizobium meliloti]|nr:hypothetical protein [Sinorhizobium meliloti]
MPIVATDFVRTERTGDPPGEMLAAKNWARVWSPHVAVQGDCFRDFVANLSYGEAAGQPLRIGRRRLSHYRR